MSYILCITVDFIIYIIIFDCDCPNLMKILRASGLNRFVSPFFGVRELVDRHKNKQRCTDSTVKLYDVHIKIYIIRKQKLAEKVTTISKQICIMAIMN